MNFAQVNGIATVVNTNWNTYMKETLAALSNNKPHSCSTELVCADFSGAMSVEAMLSLDCLFSEDGLTHRSIGRVILSLLLPFFVLSFLHVYWWLNIRGNFAMLKRRLVLRAVVVFSISYIGWVQRLSSALNCISIPHDVVNGEEISQLYWTEEIGRAHV